MLKCREVVNRADELVDGAMPRREQLALKMHLLMCYHCRRYVRQLKALISAIPFMHGKASDAEVFRVMDYIRNRQSEHP